MNSIKLPFCFGYNFTRTTRGQHLLIFGDHFVPYDAAEKLWARSHQCLDNKKTQLVFAAVDRSRSPSPPREWQSTSPQVRPSFPGPPKLSTGLFNYLYQKTLHDAEYEYQAQPRPMPPFDQGSATTEPRRARRDTSSNSRSAPSASPNLERRCQCKGFNGKLLAETGSSGLARPRLSRNG